MSLGRVCILYRSIVGTTTAEFSVRRNCCSLMKKMCPKISRNERKEEKARRGAVGWFLGERDGGGLLHTVHPNCVVTNRPKRIVGR
jgi:hypothetical protein